MIPDLAVQSPMNTVFPIPKGLCPPAQQRCWVVNRKSWSFSMVDFRGRLCCSEGFELMIHVDQQAAHDRGERDFTWFFFTAQTLVERLQDGIKAGRAERRHVQGQPDFGATAADTAEPFHRATLSGPGSQAGQGGHLLAVDRAQFADSGQTEPDRAWADAGD